MRTMTYNAFTLLIILWFGFSTTATAAATPAKPTVSGGTLTMEVTVTPGSGDDPMIMVWLETSNGTFVRTLQTFGIRTSVRYRIRRPVVALENKRILLGVITPVAPCHQNQ